MKRVRLWLARMARKFTGFMGEHPSDDEFMSDVLEYPAPMARVVWRDVTQINEHVRDEDITLGHLIRFETIGRAVHLKEKNLWVITVEQPLHEMAINPPWKKLVPDVLVEEVTWLEEKSS